MEQVFVAQHPTEAHLVRGLLEANGIVAVVHGEILFSVRGETPMTADTLPSVWVAESDAARARALLAEYGPHASPSGAIAWICPSCGERIEAQFTECWRCAAGRRNE